MTQIRTVLYDLDGTLVDNFGAIHLAISHTGDQLGLRPPSYETAVGAVGGGVRVTLGRLFGEAHADAAYEIFQAYFPKVALFKLEALPGAMWLLKNLHGRGLRQAVLTNKEGRNARRICEHLKMDTWLDRIVGSLDTDWIKPDARLTNRVLAAIDDRADPASAVYIGDSPYDAATAANVGMAGYLVSTGSHSAAALAEEASGASGIYPDLYALAEDVFGLEAPAYMKA